MLNESIKRGMLLTVPYSNISFKRFSVTSSENRLLKRGVDADFLWLNFMHYLTTKQQNYSSRSYPEVNMIHRALD